MSLNNIAILGAGTMGHGIGQIFAQHGLAVTVYDPHPAALQAASEKVLRNLRLLQENQGGEAVNPGLAVSNLMFTSDLSAAITGADLVIEAVPENLTIKWSLYSQIAPMLKPTAIVTSNTSTFALETLAFEQPFADRFLITHFFNPAPLIPLVEIVQLDITMPGIAGQLIELLRACGKVPVLLKKDIAGFIANRLQAAVMREACYLLESGIAEAAQIDTAMKEGPGLRWAIGGPFEIADYGGLDVWEKVTGHLFPQLGASQEAPELIREKVAKGELGVKTGAGFYTYGDPAQQERQSGERDRKLLGLLQVKAGNNKA